MARRLLLIATALASSLGTWSPAAAAGPAGPAPERAVVKLVDASVEADECQYRAGSIICVGKVVLKATQAGEPKYVVALNADKVTVKLAKPPAGKPQGAPVNVGRLQTILAEGNVHYDVLADSTASASARQVVGDAQELRYDCDQRTLDVSNLEKAPIEVVITETRRPTPENGLTEPEKTQINLTARRVLTVSLADEAPAAGPAPAGK